MLSARFGGIVYSATQSYLDYYGVSEASAAARDFGGVTVNGSDVINAQNGIRLSEHRTVFPNTIHIAQLMYVCRKRLLDTLFLNKLWGIADITVSLVGRNLWMLYCKAPLTLKRSQLPATITKGLITS